MKLFISTLFLMSLFLSNAQNFTSSTPIPVGNNYGYYHPQIEITNDGQPFVLWTNQNDKTLYTSKYDGNSSFSAPLAISPVNLDVQSYNWSGADLTIENDNIYIVFRSAGYETGHVYLVKSTDNGLTFSDTVRVDDLATGYGQYPDIAVNQDTVWVTFMDHDAAGLAPQYVVARSVDGGATFETEVLAGALTGDEACDCCQPEIIVNDSYIIVYFRNNDNNIRDIKGVVSFDRGATFNTWFSVDDHLWNINACPSTGPDSRFINETTSVTIYKTTISGDAKVYVNQYNHSTNSSTDLVEIFDINSDNLLVNYPQIAIENGVIGVVWEAKGSTSGAGTDIFINSSSSGVTGLLGENAFNLTNITGNQNKPDIALTNNNFHVVYSDYSNGGIKYVKLQSVTGVDEYSTNAILTVYPNPAINEININFIDNNNENGTLVINSINGQEVYRTAFNKTDGSLKIDVTQWKKGIYYLKCTINEKETVFKIVI